MKDEKDNLAELYGILNVACGIMDTLIEEKMVSENLEESQKYFPRGGLPVLQEQLIRAYETVQHRLDELERKP